jgi:DNA-binding MarR family transcriptional regulator
MVLSRFQIASSPVSRATLAEKEVVRLAIQLARPIRPKDVVDHFGIDRATAVRMLRSLCGSGWLIPVLSDKGRRITRYDLARNVLDYLD